MDFRQFSSKLPLPHLLPLSLPLSLPPFSPRAFLHGLGGAFVLLVCLAGFLWLQSGKTVEKLQARMPSKTVLIDRGGTGAKYAGETPPSAYRPASSAAPAEDIVRDKNSLVQAPLEGLYSTEPYGILPLIDQKTGNTPFKAYKRPYVPIAGKPVIALGIVDMGLSAKATLSAIRSMPANVSLVLSPYGDHIDYWRQKARADGHEVWVSLPLENKTYPHDDPGSQVLLRQASLKKNQDRLLWALSRMAGYAGVVAPAGHSYTNADIEDTPLMKQIFGRGLGFIDMNSDGAPLGDVEAGIYHAPYMTDVMVLDTTLQAQAIVENIKLLESKAREDGYAVGVIHPVPLSYHIALKWIEGLGKRGFQLSPLSGVM